MLQVHFLFARHERDGDVGLGLEIKVPEGRGVLCGFVEGGSGEGTLAPDDAGDSRRELSDVCMGDHAADIVTHDVDGAGDADVLGDECVQIASEDVFGVAVWRVGGVPRASIVRGDDSIAGVGERVGDVAELIGRFREAVDEEDGVFRLGGGGETFDVVDPDLRVGLLEPDLAVVGDGGVLGCHG